jgi:hypothetical protein
VAATGHIAARIWGRYRVNLWLPVPVRVKVELRC